VNAISDMTVKELTSWSYSTGSTPPEGTDDDNATAVYSLSSDPDVSINSSTGLISGTFNYNHGASRTLTVGVAYGDLSASRTFHVTVTPDTTVHIDPIELDDPTVYQDNHLSATAHATTRHPNLFPLTYSLGTHPEGMQIDSGTGEIAWDT